MGKTGRKFGGGGALLPNTPILYKVKVNANYRNVHFIATNYSIKVHTNSRNIDFIAIFCKKRQPTSLFMLFMIADSENKQFCQ